MTHIYNEKKNRRNQRHGAHNRKTIYNKWDEMKKKIFYENEL